MTPDLILVVDDDPEIRSLLCDYLREAGLRADAAADGAAMWRWLEHHKPDLIVLDLMLPGVDGLALCRALQERSKIPVIMLTARGALIDRIVGLEMGADDYMAKPFDPRELLARIRGVLRRARQYPAQSEPDAAASLCFDGWRLDTRGRQLISDDGVVIGLGASDYRVLRILMERPHHIVSRDYLSEHAFGKPHTPFSRAVDVSISRLRQHLDIQDGRASAIRTIRNGGYVFAADVTARP